MNKLSKKEALELLKSMVLEDIGFTMVTESKNKITLPAVHERHQRMLNYIKILEK